MGNITFYENFKAGRSFDSTGFSLSLSLHYLPKLTNEQGPWRQGSWLSGWCQFSHISLPRRFDLFFQKKKMLLIFSWVCWHPTHFPFRPNIKEFKWLKRACFFSIRKKKKNNNPAITYTALIYVPSGFGQGRADSNTFFKYYILKANKLTGKMVAKNEGVFSESSCISPLLPWDPGAGWCDEISLDWGMWTIPRLLLTSFAP